MATQLRTTLSTGEVFQLILDVAYRFADSGLKFAYLT